MKYSHINTVTEKEKKEEGRGRGREINTVSQFASIFVMLYVITVSKRETQFMTYIPNTINHIKNFYTFSLTTTRIRLMNIRKNTRKALIIKLTNFILII